MQYTGIRHTFVCLNISVYVCVTVSGVITNRGQAPKYS